MGTISIQVTRTGAPNGTRSFDMPDAQIDRVITAFQQGANSAVNGTATRAQVLGYFASWLIKEKTVEYVQSVERDAVIAAAVAAVTPIDPT